MEMLTSDSFTKTGALTKRTNAIRNLLQEYLNLSKSIDPGVKTSYDYIKEKLMACTTPFYLMYDCGNKAHCFDFY